MIKPKCDKCGEELRAYGALVFSPPETFADDSPGRSVDKFHVCALCWPKLQAWMRNIVIDGVQL
jgi:hypothetical protein